VKTAFRFDAPIVVVKLTHKALKTTLEAALRGVGTSRGQFPQVSGGVLLEYVAEAPEQQPRLLDGRVIGVRCEGARVWNLVVPGPKGPVIVVSEGRVLKPNQTVLVATLEYLQRGGDGWFPGGTADIYPVQAGGKDVGEQRAFVEFLTDATQSGIWNGGRAYVDQPDPTAGVRIRRVSTPGVRHDARCDD
jgi:hypothetical protein